MRKAIAIDFDGCLCEDGWPGIGRPNPAVIEAALHEQRKGAALILWTCRSGPLLDDAVRFCRKYGLEFDAVTENLPERIERYGTDCRKISADEYWDDHALPMPSRAMPPNNPLSLETLLEMEGMPVWVHLTGWALVCIHIDPDTELLRPWFLFSSGETASAEDYYDAGFVSYRRKPEELSPPREAEGEN